MPGLDVSAYDDQSWALLFKQLMDIRQREAKQSKNE